jgi:hypothetical protein
MLSDSNWVPRVFHVEYEYRTVGSNPGLQPCQAVPVFCVLLLGDTTLAVQARLCHDL